MHTLEIHTKAHSDTNMGPLYIGSADLENFLLVSCSNVNQGCARFQNQTTAMLNFTGTWTHAMPTKHFQQLTELCTLILTRMHSFPLTVCCICHPPHVRERRHYPPLGVTTEKSKALSWIKCVQCQNHILSSKQEDFSWRSYGLRIWLPRS